MAVASKQGLIDYCLRELGYPVSKINVTDEQIEDRVEEALEFFREYHFDGIERVYLKHQLTQSNIDSKSISLDDSLIYGVTKVHLVPESTSTNDLFNLEYQFRIQDMYNLLDADLINYTMAHQHLALLNHTLVGHKHFRYNRIKNEINLDTSLSSMALGDYILVECYRVLDPAESTGVWSNQWLKHYTTALIKRQWGTNLKKFSNMQIPGGQVIDGQALYSEGNEEVEALKSELMDKSAPLDFLLG